DERQADRFPARNLGGAKRDVEDTDQPQNCHRDDDEADPQDVPEPVHVPTSVSGEAWRPDGVEASPPSSPRRLPATKSASLISPDRRSWSRRVRSAIVCGCSGTPAACGAAPKSVAASARNHVMIK